MVVWSKIEPEVRNLGCDALAHDWTKFCSVAALDLFFASCYGTLRLFTLLHLARYLTSAIKKKKKTKLKKLVKMVFRSAMCVTAISTGTITFSCILRNLLGKYYYYTLCYIPATISALAILWESPKGKEIAVNTFANCGLEYWFWELKRRNIVTWTQTQQTIVFMIFSSLLSFLFSTTRFDQNYYWFFIPPKIINDESQNAKTPFQKCFHENDCWKYYWKNFLMYSSTGFVVQIAKILIYNFENINVVLTALKTRKTYRLAAFLGFYVSVFEAVRCYFYKKQKKNSSVHDAIAGFLAGVTFRFQPTVQILNTGVISVIQILTEITKRKKIIPNISYSEMVFVFFCGWLFHVTVVLKDHSPPLAKYIFSTVSNRRADKVAEKIIKLSLVN